MRIDNSCTLGTSPRRSKSQVSSRNSVSPKRLKTCIGKNDPLLNTLLDSETKQSQVSCVKGDLAALESSVAVLRRGRTADSATQNKSKLSNIGSEQQSTNSSEACNNPKKVRHEQAGNESLKRNRTGLKENVQTPVRSSSSTVNNSPRKNKFYIGQECLSRWNDGLLYLGTVIKVLLVCALNQCMN